MTILDWSIVAVVVLSVTLAAAQGFFFELFSLAGSVLGYVLAMWEYPRVAGWFLPFVKAQPYANFAAFLTIFFSALLLAGMIARLMRWAIHEVGLRWADRLLGGAFGLARGLVIVCVGIMAAAAFAPNSPTLARSQLSGYFLLAARTASWVAPSELRAKVREGAVAIRNMNPDSAAQPETKQSTPGTTDLRAGSEKKQQSGPSTR